jgi:hypothetical protein
MTLPRTTADVLSEHVSFEVECNDRMYLLSGLAGDSSQFTGRAWGWVGTVPGHDRVPGSGGSGGSAGGFAGADRRPVGAVAAV